MDPSGQQEDLGQLQVSQLCTPNPAFGFSALCPTEINPRAHSGAGVRLEEAKNVFVFGKAVGNLIPHHGKCLRPALDGALRKVSLAMVFKVLSKPNHSRMP